MKFVPDAIARKVAEQGFLASKNSPRILFVGGVVGMVGSTVLACRATLKLDEVLDTIENDRKRRLIESRRPSRIRITPEKRHILTTSSARISRSSGFAASANVAKLYAPSVLLGAASIAALTKSHNILQERNLALTAAYALVDGAFTRYRERVVDRYGEDVDRDLRYESEQVDILDEETGKIVATTRVTGGPGSAYARFYDEVVVGTGLRIRTSTCCS
jgi:hypothetical protein